jgi:phosphocarrier protein
MPIGAQQQRKRQEEFRMTHAKASALLINEVGLHARPSVKLTQTAKRFASELEVALAADGPWVDAKSPVKIMRVKARKGTVLHFRAKGPDADEAVKELASLVERRFDEEGA